MKANSAPAFCFVIVINYCHILLEIANINFLCLSLVQTLNLSRKLMHSCLFSCSLHETNLIERLQDSVFIKITIHLDYDFIKISINILYRYHSQKSTVDRYFHVAGQCYFVCHVLKYSESRKFIAKKLDSMPNGVLEKWQCESKHFFPKSIK